MACGPKALAVTLELVSNVGLSPTVPADDFCHIKVLVALFTQRVSALQCQTSTLRLVILFIILIHLVGSRK